MDNNRFWDFSLRHYTNAVVQGLCLELQETVGANVNLILFSGWLAAERRIFRPVVVSECEPFQEWRRQVVLPLRQSRCAVKRLQGRSEVYEALKKAELQVERVEQDRLFELETRFDRAPLELSVPQLADENLRGYLATLPLPPARLAQLSEQLTRELFLDEPG